MGYCVLTRHTALSVPEGPVKNYQVKVSIDDNLKAWLLARAEERGCSLSQAAREVLHRAMREGVQRGK